MNYILDTNIILTYIRKNELSKIIDKKYNPQIWVKTICGLQQQLRY